MPTSYMDRISIEPGKRGGKREDVQACLLFAADRERKLVSISTS